MASIKKNFYYNSVLTVTNYIIPLLVFPYVSRVLGVTNIGICSLVDSIINYFVLFSMMGMTTLGIREIAKVKDDKDKLSNTFSSLLVLNGITTVFAVLILLISIFIVPSFYQYKELFYVGLFKLFFNFLLIEWFYRGIENFKYITIRSVIIRILFALSVFLFIRSPEDYDIYFLLMSLTTILNAVINVLYFRKFVRFSFRGISLTVFLKSFLILGLYLFLTSMYTTFNVAYLGMVSTADQVGYFTTAQKLYTIILSFYTAFTSVMLPRMSSLISNDDKANFIRYIEKSIDVLYTFSVPVVIVGIIYSSELIFLLSGKGYEGAILPMVIMMPLVFFVGYDQVLVIQILTSLRKDKQIFYNAVIGAIIGISINLLLVPRLESIGSAIVCIASEIGVFSSACYFSYKDIGLRFSFVKLLRNIIAYIPLILIFLMTYDLVYNSFVKILAVTVVTIVYMAIVQKWFLKNEVFLSYLNKLKIIKA